MKKITACLLFLVISIFLFTGCAQSTESVIRIATKPMVEQYILGEILSLIIENETGYQVDITKGIAGGTSNIHPAMEKGDFDLYPEYTSTGYVMVLGHPAAGVSDDEIWDKLQAEYAEKFGMAWISRYGFNNTFCIAVREDIAKQYNLKTTSDLAPVAGELVFGSNPDYYERADGFDALRETYGLNFKRTVEIDIGLRWAAISAGDIDVTTGFTTDAELVAYNTIVLEDDLNLQVNYFCSTVVRMDALEKFPGLEAALKKMEGLISNTEMSRLNYQVSIEEKDEREVARAFLIEKGLLFTAAP
ncbi:MAG: glycine/betaine ABC transporter substrate-binding protein [Lachnospiraceae bacterium]|nr:glycine/betaine ABC transporter substrate-binding protein [Lachnospiraceae bacterium]